MAKQPQVFALWVIWVESLPFSGSQFCYTQSMDIEPDYKSHLGIKSRTTTEEKNPWARHAFGIRLCPLWLMYDLGKMLNISVPSQSANRSSNGLFLCCGHPARQDLEGVSQGTSLWGPVNGEGNSISAASITIISLHLYYYFLLGMFPASLAAKFSTRTHESKGWLQFLPHSL